MQNKKKFKIVGFAILILILIGIGYIGISYYCWVSSMEPRRPKLKIPITYNIGWWANQKMLSIDSFNVEVVECKLNLFNSKSLISYKVSGYLNYEWHWQPKIKEVHISERINNDTTLQYDRIIEITPIVKTKKNEKVKGGSDKFEFKNEHTITSNHYGINRIKFVCGQKEQIIELRQTK